MSRNGSAVGVWLRAAGGVGVTGLFLFVFGFRVSPSLAYVGLALMDAAFLASLALAWPRLRHEPLTWVFIGFTAYLLARTALAMHEFPDTGARQVRDAWNYFHLWLFVVLSWWLAARPERVMRILGLALASLIIGILIRLDPREIAGVLQGERAGFGMPAIAFGLYSATALLGLAAFARRLWGPSTRRLGFSLRILGWAVLVAALAEGLLATQSRGSWLAFILVMPPLAWLSARHALGGNRNSSSGRPGRGGWLAVLGVVLAAGFVVANSATIRERLSAETETMRAVLTLDYAHIPTHRQSSIGVRFHLNRLGLQKWLERPWLGWGPGSTRMLIEDNEIAELREWSDLHNSYLEILVRLGIVGAAFFLAGAWLVWRALRAARTDPRVPRDLYLFLNASLALLALWSLTDFRMTAADWKFYWLLLGGMVFTYRLFPAGGPSAERA
jgi:O-antigen ligase